MKTMKHGMSIGMGRVDDNFMLTLKVTGKLTHEDYKTINPMIDSALQEVSDAKIDAIIDGTEWEGWELRAAWDDFRLGLKHGKEFRKIAIYGHKHWQELSAKLGSWFTTGKVKYFESESEALEWLKE